MHRDARAGVASLPDAVVPIHGARIREELQPEERQGRGDEAGVWGGRFRIVGGRQDSDGFPPAQGAGAVPPHGRLQPTRRKQVVITDSRRRAKIDLFLGLLSERSRWRSASFAKECQWHVAPIPEKDEALPLLYLPLCIYDCIDDPLSDLELEPLLPLLLGVTAGSYSEAIRFNTARL